MTEADAAALLAALSHETRLKIFRILIRAGHDGVAAGQLAQALGVSPSNLTAHLNVLSQAGLVGARRDGRNRFYQVDIPAVAGLVDYLVSDCCEGQKEVCGPVLARAGGACD